MVLSCLKQCSRSILGLIFVKTFSACETTALSEEVVFNQRNAASRIINFLFRFSQRITGRICYSLHNGAFMLKTMF